MRHAATTTVRGAAGLAPLCRPYASFDNLHTLRRSVFRRRIARLNRNGWTKPAEQWPTPPAAVNQQTAAVVSIICIPSGNSPEARSFHQGKWNGRRALLDRA
jgi:hypothetical protein